MSKFLNVIKEAAAARLEAEKAWAASRWAKLEADAAERLRRVRQRQARAIRTSACESGFGGCPA